MIVLGCAKWSFRVNGDMRTIVQTDVVYRRYRSRSFSPLRKLNFGDAVTLVLRH